MKLTEAREALANTFESIKAEALSKGIDVSYKCFVSDRDLTEVDINDSAAQIIAGELTLGCEGTEQKIVLECAVSSAEGEVFEEELLGEITQVRGSIREFYDKIEELGSAVAALESIYSPEDEPVEEVKTFDNRKFYIYGGIFIALVAVILILSKVL